MFFTHPQLKNIKPLFGKISEEKLKNKLSKFFPGKDIIFTNLGRSAFQIAVKKLGLENSEILMPGYICDIFKPIFEKYNIKPIYLDIDLKTFNIDPENIERKITPQTKSILVSHTYGLLADMDKIIEIAKKYNLKIIEDCAHIIPKKIYGDCAFFSFPKLCPTINGGMLVSDKEIGVRLPKYKRNLFNMVKFARLFPVLAGMSEWFRAKNNQGETKRSQREPRGASKLSLRVFNWYLDNLEEQLSKTTKLAECFHKKLKQIGFQSSGITYISALVPENMNRDELFNKLRKKGIYCSRIWHKPLYPDLPNTSIAASRIINFPFQAWFEKNDIDKMAEML